MTRNFDMERAIAVACDTMADLSALIATENQALEDKRLHAVGDLAERKERLARNLDTLFSGLRDQKARFAEFIRNNPGTRETLQEHWSRLHAQVERNAELLRRSQDVAQKVLDAIVDEARRAHQEQKSGGMLYGRAGRSGGADESAALSVSLNTTL